MAWPAPPKLILQHLLHDAVASAPIRIRDEDKARLERLQHALSRISGRKPSQQDVVGRAVEFAARHKEAFLSESAWTPPPPAVARKWLAQAEDLGDWSSADIDAIVYGDGA
jgi:hypothetical protein